jgi:hypothetical protein
MEPGAVVPGEDRFEKPGCDPVIQIVGEVPDPNPPVGTRCCRFGRRAVSGLVLQVPAEIAPDPEQRGGVGMRIEGGIEAKRRHGVDVIGRDLVRMPEEAQSLLQFAARDVDIAQVIEGIVPVGCAGKGALQIGDRRAVAAGPFQAGPAGILRVGGFGKALGGPAGGRDRFGESFLRHEAAGEEQLQSAVIGERPDHPFDCQGGAFQAAQR